MMKSLRRSLAPAWAFAALAAAVAGPAAALDTTAALNKAEIIRKQLFAAAPPAAVPMFPALRTAPPPPRPAPAPRPGQNGRAQPDWTYTPGKLCTKDDPDFQEYRYPEHVPYCNRNVTLQMKQEIAAHYRIPQSRWGDYEFDHLIPLGIGGNSRVDNVWPQPREANGSDDKDKLENELYLQMDAGTITQDEAVKRIYAWFQNFQAASAVPAGLSPAGRP